jgi:hypothetical protein
LQHPLTNSGYGHKPPFTGGFLLCAETAEGIATDLTRLLGDLLTLIKTPGAYSMFIPHRNIETGHGTSCYATASNSVTTSPACTAIEVSDS